MSTFADSSLLKGTMKLDEIESLDCCDRKMEMDTHVHWISRKLGQMETQANGHDSNPWNGPSIPNTKQINWYEARRFPT